MGRHHNPVDIVALAVVQDRLGWITGFHSNLGGDAAPFWPVPNGV